MTIGVSSACIAISAVIVVTTQSATVALVALGTFIAVPAETFTSRIVGTVAGLGGMLGGVAGMIGQLLLGRTLQHGSFMPRSSSRARCMALRFCCCACSFRTWVL
jgi:hypothetical protein